MSEVEIPSPPLSILQEPEEVSEKGAESDEARADPLTLTSEPKASFDIDESLRSAIGHLAGNYPCVYDNTKGNMFVGSQEVVFVGWTFFFEKRVEIKWINVLRVVKTESVGGSCISFVMRTSDQQYDFSSIANSERVWATLVSIHNKVLHDAPTRAPLTTTLRASLRRMSSDPLSNLPTIRIADGPTGMEAAYVAAATIANMDDLRCLSPTNAAASAVARRQSLMQTHIEDAAEVTPDLEEAWRELQQGGGKASYATSAIQDLILPCDFQNFFDNFIADSASYSFKMYMESSGESNVIVSPWKKGENDIFARTIEYSHPVNAPLAPPMARARREQRYRFYGKHGLSVETDTYVEDVPMADCFYVTERTLVEPKDEGQVVVLAEFDIRFVKSTMFRSIIANTTRSECLKGIQGLGKYWMEALALLETPDEAVTRRRSSIESAEPRRSSISELFTPRKSIQFETILDEAPEKAPMTRLFARTPVMMLLLGLMLLMQSWMVLELKGMRHAMVELQTSITDLQTKGTCLSESEL